MNIEAKIGILTYNRKFSLAVAGLFLISFLLEFYYANFICPKYFYSGFIMDFNIVKYVESKVWLVILLFLSIVVNNKSRFVSALFLFLMMMIYIPGHIIYAYSDGLTSLFYSTIAFFVILSIIGPFKLKLNIIKTNSIVTFYGLVLFAILLVIPVFNDFRLNINPNVLMLDDIYDVRSVLKNNISFISSYTFWWLGKVVLPVLLIYSLIRKDYKITLFALAVIVYLFLISGHKSVYFTPVLIVFYYFVGKDYNEKILYTMIFMLILFIGVNIPDAIIGRPIFKSIFIRRMFFVPALLNECYFDFFEGRPLLLSHSFLGGFNEYPYDVLPEYLIARTYFDKPEMSANTGIVANAFMNFGYLGVLIYSVIFSIFMSILNSLDLNRKYFGLFIFFMFIFRGSPFFTTILTHGFWLVLVLAFTVLPRRE